MDIKTLTLIHKLLAAEQEAAETEYALTRNAYLLAKREYERGEHQTFPEGLETAYKTATKRVQNANHALDQFTEHDWT